MKALIAILFLANFHLYANEFVAPNIDYCNNGKVLTDDLPVQAGGRVKPYYVVAKENMKFIWGKKKSSPTQAFCQITFASRITDSKLDVPILVEHVDTKKFLGIKEADAYISSEVLLNKKDLLRSEIFQQKENNSYKKDLNKLFARLETFEQIKNGIALSVYVKKPEGSVWRPIQEFQDLSDEEIASLIKNSNKLYLQENGDHHLLELTYFKSHIFSYALLIALIGIFITVLSKKLTWPIVMAIITLLVQITGMTMRIFISGRAPITNMYETVMFSGTGSLIIALLILIWKRDKMFLLAGLGYNILCLFMMMFANNMLSSSISPLVPVLRDNFWLSTHVTTIILSYAALALTWLVANITLVKLRLNKITAKEYRYAQDLIYTCMKIGVVLLAAGIILGGVWADYSWGRFWGWDPKETWSLIVLLFYMVIMHGKYTNWFNTHRFVLLSAAGFMTVMMAWFGVNYILASGLHSYGFSEGGAIFLGSFFIAQIAILVICGVKPELQSEAS